MFKKLLFFLVFLTLNFLIILSHSHNNEPPHLKYTKEINEKVILKKIFFESLANFFN